MKKDLTNFAFIDSQNIHLGIQELGWKLDYRRFRVYLREKYAVGTAYLFLGYLPEQQTMYSSLQKSGYVLIFKPILMRPGGKPKGNIDAELVLQTMIDYDKYERAVIATSDGDFHCVVKYLRKQRKLEVVLSPGEKTCSALLKKGAGGRLRYLEVLENKLKLK